MKKTFHLGFFCFAVLSIAFFLAGAGCANIIPPTGGPRDSLPPVLVSALPVDSTTNFSSKKIVLTFNEYVQLGDNLNEELIISPYPDNIPQVEGKLRTVTIRLRDSLKPNTTYSLNFGKSLKDVNEGNISKNFTYVFSTGSYLDSGTVSGHVMLAETGEIDSTLLVVLYGNLSDSAVKKLRPQYYTRLDSAGYFHFRYLPPETFNVYVLPNDYSKRYDDSTKMFAFYNQPVNPGDASVQLDAFQQFKPKERTSEEEPSGKKNQTEEDKRLKLTTDLENGQQSLLEPLTLTFSRNIGHYDTALINLTDTNYNPIIGFSIDPDTAANKFFFRYGWLEGSDYRILIQKNAFADSSGTALSKSDTIYLTTKNESDYGSVKLHFNKLDLAKNPVVQLLQSNNLVRSIPLTSADWSEKLFNPGTYQIRILYDQNKNGIWDPGNFEEKKQPELVQRLPRNLIIKPNWDNEVDINL